jgi:hypothetical protein
VSRGFLWAAILAAALPSCHPPRAAVLYGPATPLTIEDYPSVLATWTRSAKVYDHLENKVFATATFHAPEFRRAFPIAFPEIYGQGGEITRRELVDLTGDVESFFNFFLAVYTPVSKWNDLDKRDSIWRFTLIGSEEVAVGPAQILPIKIDENLRAVYPYVGHFDKCYLVRFPMTDPMKRLVIDAKTTSFKLRIASALGVAEMTWNLELVPGAEAPKPLPARVPPNGEAVPTTESTPGSDPQRTP